ncbi:MAG TPA: lysophospholipid acyltransferase family protein [Gemmatimonadaceae bacterium]|nr:lysophospholipid acyltransferase family protein [Gemmatimonadaceae bacterium]
MTGTRAGARVGDAPHDTLGPPRRGSALSRALAARVLRLAGWRIEGGLPPHAKFVAVLAPHTSNWDFIFCILSMWALGLRLTWLAKHTLFRPPLGALLRWLGGEPVDRRAGGGAVFVAVECFRTRAQYALGITPEGTRRRVEEWKTGFHRIARAAGVPVVPVWFDYPNRVVGIGEPAWMTEDVESDVARLRALFRKEMARHPEQFAEAKGPRH